MENNVGIGIYLQVCKHAVFQLSITALPELYSNSNLGHVFPCWFTKPYYANLIYDSLPACQQEDLT